MLNNFEFQRYIQAIADNAGVSVQWTHDTEPCTDGKTIFMPAGKLSDTEEDWQLRLWWAVHEAGGHHRFTDFNINKGKNVHAGNSLLGFIHNALEDIRIDTLNAAQYEGDRVLGNWAIGKELDKLVDVAFKHKNSDKAENAIPLVQFMADFYATHGFENAAAFDGKFSKFLGTEGKERVSALKKYAEEMHDVATITDPTKGTKATYELAKRIFEEVYKQDAKKEEERCQAEAGKKKKEKAGGEGGEGKQEGKGDGKDGDKEGEGKGKGKHGKAAPGEEENGDGEIESVDYSDFINDKHHERNEGKGHHVNYDPYRDYNKPYMPPSFSAYKTIDFTKGESAGGGGHTSYQHYYNYNEQFGNRVRQLLQVRDRARWEYARKSGQMHRPALHRVVIKDAPGFNQRIFKKKIVSDTLNTAITVLIDSSGSMSGDKYGHAIAAACMLNESLGNTLHMPIEILGFTEWGKTPVNFIHRKHNDRLVSKEKLVVGLEDAGRRLLNNADGDSILWAYDRLCQRKEKRKLLIVISDGSPAYSGTRGDIVKYTKDVVARIQDERKVEVYGIGVMDSNVRMFYKDNCVIHSSSELEPALLNLIERKVV